MLATILLFATNTKQNQILRFVITDTRSLYLCVNRYIKLPIYNTHTLLRVSLK